MNEEKKNKKIKIGVYVCHCGGNISDVVDVEKVRCEIEGVDCVHVVKRNMFMCSNPGQKMIVDDIKNEKLDRVVVAACSPSLHEFSFRNTLKRAGLNPYLYEHANIREQVSWCSKDDPEGATAKAKKIVSAAVEKVKLAKPLEKIRVDIIKSVAVIGSGPSGLKSAIDLSNQGMKVYIIEKEDVLGGQLRKVDKLFPTDESAEELLTSLISKLENNMNVEIYKGAEVVATTGHVGNFSVDIACGNDKKSIPVGAIIIATGFESYVPHRGEYGYGDYKEVVTLTELNGLLLSQRDSNKLEFNGKIVRNIGFIHCVGSRQVEGIDELDGRERLNDYCSRYCCTSLLHMEERLLDKFPSLSVYDFYQDIRTYGRGHEDYYDRVSRKGGIFFRWTSDSRPKVLGNVENTPLMVNIKDTLTFGKEIDVPVDLLVLATGMEPKKIDSLVDILKLPRSIDGFLQEVHPKLKPVELAVLGIFIAGTCQAPMNASESSASASAASAKAAILLSKGYIELEPFVAEINCESCSGGDDCNLECIAECGDKKALDIVELQNGAKVVEVNKTICDSCGMCVAVCPHDSIQLPGQHISQFDAMVDAITEYT